jgi:hypothetical protein
LSSPASISPTWSVFIVMSSHPVSHLYVFLAHVEKHEELIYMGSPDSHTISEGQKSAGTSKSTRKGKEKSAERERTAKEKQGPRFEPQVGAIPLSC